MASRGIFDTIYDELRYISGGITVQFEPIHEGFPVIMIQFSQWWDDRWKGGGLRFGSREGSLASHRGAQNRFGRSILFAAVDPNLGR